MGFEAKPFGVDAFHKQGPGGGQRQSAHTKDPMNPAGTPRGKEREKRNDSEEPPWGRTPRGRNLERSRQKLWRRNNKKQGRKVSEAKVPGHNR